MAQPEEETPVEGTKTHVYEIRVTVPQSTTLPVDEDVVDAVRGAVGGSLPTEALRISASYDEI